MGHAPTPDMVKYNPGHVSQESGWPGELRRLAPMDARVAHEIAFWCLDHQEIPQMVTFLDREHQGPMYSLAAWSHKDVIKNQKVLRWVESVAQIMLPALGQELQQAQIDAVTIREKAPADERNRIGLAVASEREEVAALKAQAASLKFQSDQTAQDLLDRAPAINAQFDDRRIAAQTRFDDATRLRHETIGDQLIEAGEAARTQALQLQRERQKVVDDVARVREEARNEVQQDSISAGVIRSLYRDLDNNGIRQLIGGVISSEELSKWINVVSSYRKQKYRPIMNVIFRPKYGFHYAWVYKPVSPTDSNYTQIKEVLATARAVKHRSTKIRSLQETETRNIEPNGNVGDSVRFVAGYAQDPIFRQRLEQLFDGQNLDELLARLSQPKTNITPRHQQDYVTVKMLQACQRILIDAQREDDAAKPALKASLENVEQERQAAMVNPDQQALDEFIKAHRIPANAVQFVARFAAHYMLEESPYRNELMAIFPGQSIVDINRILESLNNFSADVTVFDNNYEVASLLKTFYLVVDQANKEIAGADKRVDDLRDEIQQVNGRFVLPLRR